MLCSAKCIVLNLNQQWLVRRLACRVGELEEMELHLNLET